MHFEILGEHCNWGENLWWKSVICHNYIFKYLKKKKQKQNKEEGRSLKKKKKRQKTKKEKEKEEDEGRKYGPVDENRSSQKSRKKAEAQRLTKAHQ